MIGLLKLSLVSDEVRVLLRFYLIVVCQILILFCIIARRTWLNSTNSIVDYGRPILVCYARSLV